MSGCQFDDYWGSRLENRRIQALKYISGNNGDGAMTIVLRTKRGAVMAEMNVAE